MSMAESAYFVMSYMKKQLTENTYLDLAQIKLLARLESCKWQESFMEECILSNYGSTFEQQRLQSRSLAPESIVARNWLFGSPLRKYSFGYHFTVAEIFPVSITAGVIKQKFHQNFSACALFTRVTCWHCSHNWPQFSV